MVKHAAMAHHRITSSALTRIDCGIVMPRAFAVFRLTTTSNLVGCSIGRLPGLAPFKILSMYHALPIGAFGQRSSSRPVHWSYYWDTIDTCAASDRVLHTLGSAGFAGVHRRLEPRIFSEYRVEKPAH